MLTFDPEDGGDMFHRNFGSHMNHKELYPRIGTVYIYRFENVNF
jgi:hypothetical protein